MRKYVNLPNPDLGTSTEASDKLFGVDHLAEAPEMKAVTGTGAVTVQHTKGQINIHVSPGEAGDLSWGTIGGNIEDQTDLSDRLDAADTAAAAAQSTADGAAADATQAASDAGTALTTASDAQAAAMQADADAEAAQEAADAAQADADTAISAAAAASALATAAAGTATWGGIGGSLADQTDLKNATDAIEADIAAIEAVNTAQTTHSAWFVRPEDHGAVGNGTTDDSVAMLAAIATGKTIQLTKGQTYLVGRPLTLNEGQTFEGNGATLKRTAQRSTTTSTTVTLGVTNQITVADATGFLVGEFIVLEQSSIYTTNSRQITTIVGNVITIAGTFPTSFTGSTNVYTAGAVMTSHANGFSRVRNVRFDGNRSNWTFNRWEILDELVPRGTHNVIENCRFENSPGEAVVCFGSYNRITGCYMKDLNGNGVHFSGGTHCVVDNCTIIGTNDDVNMGHQEGNITWSNLCDNNSVLNCHLEDGITGCGGMSELADSKVRIIGNSFKGHSSTCINMYGLTDTSASGDSVIMGNYFSGVTSAIGLTQSSVPAAYEGYLGRVVISGNTFVGQTNTCIAMTRCADVQVRGNTFDARGASNDIVSVNECTRINIDGNVMVGANRAVQITGTASYTVVSNNTLLNQVSNAVYGSTTVGVGNVARNNFIANEDATSANGYQAITCFANLHAIGNRIVLTNNGGGLTLVRGIQISSTAYGTSATLLPGAVCQFNTVSGTCQYGINIDGGSGKAVIQFNNVTATAILRNGGGSHVGVSAVGTYTGVVTAGALTAGAGNCTITVGGSGYSGTMTVFFVQGSNTTAFGSATIVNGAVTDVTITGGANQGTGYTTPGTTITMAFGGSLVTNNVILGTGANEDPLDGTPNLKAFNALVGIADRLPYFSGTGVLSLQTFTSTMRGLCSVASITNMRTSLGVADSSTAITVTPGATPSITVTDGGTARWTAAQDEALTTTGTHVTNRKLTLIITNDATPRTITFSTGFAANTAPLVGQASKVAIIEFITNGTAYMELSRKEGLG